MGRPAGQWAQCNEPDGEGQTRPAACHVQTLKEKQSGSVAGRWPPGAEGRGRGEADAGHTRAATRWKRAASKT